MPKRPLATASAAGSIKEAQANHFSPPVVENGPGATPNAGGFPEAGFGGGEDDDDDIFGGDVSSIMIKPD